jgi:hypothetical protein
MQNLIVLEPDALQHSYEKHKSNGLKLKLVKNKSHI